MPSFYSTQSVPTDVIGPADENYAPIPGLNPLVITDEFLQFGGNAALSLFLGYAWSGEVVSFSLYVNIVDTSTNTVVTEVYFAGANGLSTTVSLSTVYEIPANAAPKLVAQWKVLGTPGVVIVVPTTLSFSATVFENEG